MAPASAVQVSLPRPRAHGDNDNEPHAWDSLGFAHHSLGQPDTAAACYQNAVDLFRHLGDGQGSANSLTNLGDVHHTLGDTAAARTAWNEALTILTALNLPAANTVHTRLIAHAAAG